MAHDLFSRIESGGYGSYRIADTTAVDSDEMPKGWYTIKVLLDNTRIASLTEDGTTTALADHGIATDTDLTSGEVIIAKTKFTAIQLSAGAVSIQ